MNMAMTDTGSLNLHWSQALIAGFVAAGVTDAVISPGSRSTPLALVMLRHPGLRCHVGLDERSAAFFALGIAKVQRRPVLLLATSGTAPANWLPAIIEASQAGIPLLALSADRPPELHSCGANQTVPQIGMFANYVRASHALDAPHTGFTPDYLHHLAAQACEEACWPLPGPVHLNQPFREPLLPADPIISANTPSPVALATPLLALDAAQMTDLAGRIAGRPGVIVCGETPDDPELPAALTALARKLACPILAEPLSGLRFGSHDPAHVYVRYNRWLEDEAASEIRKAEWVIRIGAFPVTRNLQNYVTGITGTQARFDPLPRRVDPAHRITHLVRAEPANACRALQQAITKPCPADWLPTFATLEERAAAGAEANHISVLIDEIPNGAALFVGNSLAIRQLDSLSGHNTKAIHCHANRGASGIDGNISTAAGIAAAHGCTVALIGDLTCQHDIGGLALAAARDLVIVVVNNGGGGIFDLLPQHALPEFELGWRTPQNFDFASAAAAFGIRHTLAESNDELRQALQQALQAGGPHLIELKAQ